MSKAGMEVGPRSGRKQAYRALGSLDGEGLYKPGAQTLANELELYTCPSLYNEFSQYFWLQPIGLV